MSRIKVLLADDHLIVAEGLRGLLAGKHDVVGTVKDGHELLKAAKDLQPDVIVADISMPLLDGLEAVRKLQRQGNPAKVIILTMHRDPRIAEDAFRAGASGYVLKESAGDELVNAIQQVYEGHHYLTPLIAKDLLSVLLSAKSRDTSDPKLTPRQREILQLVAEGKTMKEAASVLNISVRTAESYKYEMMEALGVRTTAELIQYAVRSGLSESMGGRIATSRNQ